MAGQDGGRQVITGVDWARGLEKRLLHEERRPAVSTAADIMGPGLGPFAVQLFDWNIDEATFNGMWFSEPGALNAPSVSDYWAGYSVGSDVGYGIQVVTQYRERVGETPSDWEPNRFVRRFYTPLAGVQRSYSGWRRLNEQGLPGSPGPPGAAGSPGYLHPQPTPSASWVVVHGLGKHPSV